MYTTTFYSFKGGVGRTLALVNVAVELSRIGRRVLLVDFDLEAPGLHTFDALKPPAPHIGVVEYVSEFLSTLIAPAIHDYVYEIPSSVFGAGRLWVMPAGRGDEDYRLKLAGINWQDLYHRFDGYLLFEDLKAQWQKVYQPDYVFIDSRTGHTEVEGICTRQLPDAVVNLFFPNEQNLAGLRQVVADIRAEGKGPRHKKTCLHFVMSNVPDLDDEEQILTNRMEEFRKELGYEELTATIHRYESLALLNQVIFTHARPKSRLAREYRTLKDAIVADNLEDREGAVRFLKESYQPWGFDFDAAKEEVDSRLETILKLHNQDGEVLFLLAMVRKSEQRLENALALLNQAIACGNRTGDSFLERADILQELNDVTGSVADIKAALALPTLGLGKIEKAIRMLRKLAPSDLVEIVTAPAVQGLDDPQDRISVADSLNRGRGELVVASEILAPVANNPNVDEEVNLDARGSMVLILIGLSRFSEAMDLIESVYPTHDKMPIDWAFNYAMAEWGRDRRASHTSFALVIRHYGEGESGGSNEANFSQCMAVASWAAGDAAMARSQLATAEREMKKLRQSVFSCWRYYEASDQEFLSDCEAIRLLIGGEDVRPLFFPKLEG